MIDMGMGTAMAILAAIGMLVLAVAKRISGKPDSGIGWDFAVIGGAGAMAIGLIGMAYYSVTADFAIARIDELMRQFPFLRAP